MRAAVIRGCALFNSAHGCRQFTQHPAQRQSQRICKQVGPLRESVRRQGLQALDQRTIRQQTRQNRFNPAGIAPATEKRKRRKGQKVVSLVPARSGHFGTGRKREHQHGQGAGAESEAIHPRRQAQDTTDQALNFGGYGISPKNKSIVFWQLASQNG